MKYQLFNQNKSKFITLSKNVKHMGYKKQCKNCGCPIFDKETICPECQSKKIIKL